MVQKLVKVDKSLQKTFASFSPDGAVTYMFSRSITQQTDCLQNIGKIYSPSGKFAKQAKQGSCLEKEIMQGTMAGVCRRRGPRTACMDGQHQDVDRTHQRRVNQKAEVRDKWRKYVHGVANPWIESMLDTSHCLETMATDLQTTT